MRHRLSGRHFGRTAAHRAALYRNLANALLSYEVIKTTVPKAKELRRFVEPLITLAKVDSVANRPGGYTRIIKAGLRPGDKAPVAYIMLTDRPQTQEEDKAAEAAAPAQNA